MAYRITLTQADLDTFAWVGHRYGWSDEFPEPEEPGELEIPEHEAWAWKAGVEADMEGGHPPFPCLDPRSELYDKLLALWQSII